MILKYIKIIFAALALSLTTYNLNAQTVIDPADIPIDAQATSCTATAAPGDFHSGNVLSMCTESSWFLDCQEAYYSFTPSVTTGYTFYFSAGADIEASIFIFDDTPDVGNCIGAVTDYNLEVMLDVDLTAGNTYYIIFDGSDDTGNSACPGTFSIMESPCSSPDVPNNTCSSAPMIDLSQPFYGSTNCSYDDAEGEEPSGCGSIENDSWITFQAAATDAEVNYDVGDCVDDNGVQFSVWDGSCFDLAGMTELACVNPTGENTSGTFSLSGLTVGDNYYIRIDGYSGDLCTYNFTPGTGVVIIPPNDDCPDADTLTCSMGTNVVSNLQASSNDVGSLPACGGATYEDGVWYLFEGTGQDVTLSTDNAGTNFDTEISVFSGSCGSFTCVGSDKDSGTGETSEITFSTVGGTDYYIYLDGDAGAEGQFELSVSCSGVSSQDVSGTITYANGSSSAFATGHTVELYTDPGDVLTSSTTTTAGGNYVFSSVADGDYTVEPADGADWGGSTAMDITHYLKHSVALPLLTGVQLASYDADDNTSPGTNDITLMKQRIVSQISAFPAGNYAFSDGSVTVSGSSENVNIEALCYGDANGSYSGPYSKNNELQDIPVHITETFVGENGDAFEIPVKLTSSLQDLSSITLVINYDESVFNPQEVVMAENNYELHYKISNGEIRMVYSSLNATDFNADDILFYIRGTIVEINNETPFSGQLAGEFGDYDDNILYDIELEMPAYTPSDALSAESLRNNILIYPNPAKDIINVTNTKGASIAIYDVFGKKVFSQTSKVNTSNISTQSLESGTYFIKIYKSGQLVTRKVSIVK